MITLKDITLRRGQNILFQSVNWRIHRKHRMGIVGANGTGKTSLFAMLKHELQPDTGDLIIARNVKFSHVAQETPAVHRKAIDYVLDGDEELRLLEQALAELEQQDGDGTQIAKLYAQLSEIDAYTATARAAQLLSGLGFDHDKQQKMVSEFSGGWRVRLNLARALMCRSDVLLLDEPTNHLDLDAVLWLERWLSKYPGTLLLISHDRDFLDRVVDFIVHVSQQQIKVYTGNYSSFEKQRAAALLLQQSAYDKQQKQLAHMRSFVERFRAKASKARQAQSRLKAIERMDLIGVVRFDSSFEFEFKKPHKCPHQLIRLEDVGISYGETNILTDINFSILAGDRIALIGPNGAGKTSLVKLLAAELSASAGLREVGEGLKIGYFAQHQVDQLRLSESSLVHLRNIAPNESDQSLRTFLGSFGFVGNRVLEPVKNFSGGEKSRLALALLVWQRPNLLLLDEPTNHLDLDMRHALGMALQSYEGAIILVSHDRFLIRTVVDKLMLVANGIVKDFDGDLDDYQKWLFEFRRNEDSAALPVQVVGSDISHKEQRKLDAKQRERRKPLVKKMQQLEADIATLQKEVEVVEQLLANPSIYEENRKSELCRQLLEQDEVKRRLKTAEDAWFEVYELLHGDESADMHAG